MPAVLVGVPFLAAAVRVLVSPGPILLGGDISVFEVDVRRAMSFHQSLGPYDRFGWHHPGPAYFYALAAPSWLLGSGARAELFGAVAIAGASAVLSVWLVSRHAGLAAGFGCAACVGLLGYQMSAPIAGQPLGAVLGPWNPFVVTFPMVLLLILSGLSACGRPVLLIPAALVATFAAQTDLSTLPVVVLALAGAAGAATVRRLRRAHGGVVVGAPRWTRWRIVAVSVVGGLLVAAWVPPIVQQLTAPHGNVSAITAFFTAHHRPQTLGAGLWAMLAVEAVPVRGMGQEMTYVLGAPHPGALLVLAAALALGLGTMVLGLRRRQSLAVALGVGALGSGVVMTLAITRVVGALFGYLVVWAAFVPAVALVGLVVAVFGHERRRGHDTPEQVSGSGRRRTIGLALAAGMAVAVVVPLAVRLDRIDPARAGTDPSVGAAWRALGPHLRGATGPLFVGAEHTDLVGTETFFGLVAQFDHLGFHPKVASMWRNVFGQDHFAAVRPSLQVWLYPPSRSVEARPGFVVHTAHADVVLSRCTSVSCGH